MLNVSPKTRLGFVYFGGFLLAVHYASVAYLNSSLLQKFVDDALLNILFILGSILSVLCLWIGPLLFKYKGSVATFLFFIGLEAIAVFGMGNINMASWVIALFLIHQGAESMMYFSLDVNLEQQIKTESTTGGKRGLFLTIQNIAWVLSPLILATFIIKEDFSKVYTISSLSLVLLLLITLLFFKKIKNTEKQKTNIIKIFLSLKKFNDNAKILCSQFILNFFYSWMVIYLPLVLVKEIGFGWDKIGIIFTIMLLPFLLFQLPAGILSDKKFGERELLVIGFIIIFFSTLLIPFLKSTNFIHWAILLFITRIGASLVEIGGESYFFKHIKETDTGLISLFRMTRPLSSILAPLIAIPIITFLSYSTSFLFLAFFTLLGLLFIPKVDTK